MIIIDTNCGLLEIERWCATHLATADGQNLHGRHIWMRAQVMFPEQLDHKHEAAFMRVVTRQVAQHLGQDAGGIVYRTKRRSPRGTIFHNLGFSTPSVSRH